MHPHVLSGLLQPVQILMFLTFATKWESTLLLDSSVQFSRADKHNAFSFLRSSSGCWLLSSDHSIPMLNPNHMVWIYIAFLQNIKRQLFLVREYFIHITLNTVLSLFLLNMTNAKLYIHCECICGVEFLGALLTWQCFWWLQIFLFCIW